MNIKQVVVNVFRLGKQVERDTAEIQAGKAEIALYFDEHPGEDEVIVLSNNVGTNNIAAKKTERTTVEYYPDKLLKALGKERYIELVDNTYAVTNMPAMIALVKASGVDPIAFKSLIHTTPKVNKQAIQQAYSVGDITMAELKGCFTAQVSKSISVKERTGGGD